MITDVTRIQTQIVGFHIPYVYFNAVLSSNVNRLIFPGVDKGVRSVFKIERLGERAGNGVPLDPSKIWEGSTDKDDASH